MYLASIHELFIFKKHIIIFKSITQYRINDYLRKIQVFLDPFLFKYLERRG